jgi:hypothetical protein
MNKMKKNIEGLADWGKMFLERSLNKSLSSIKTNKTNLEREHIGEKDKVNYRILLNSSVEKYNHKAEAFKEKYGVEFHELQKQYEKMFPEINISELRLIKMTEDTEKLAGLGRFYLKCGLRTKINDIKESLGDFLINKDYEIFNFEAKFLKDSYGVEFPELQKQYEEILPEINKYLKPEVVNTN